MTSSRRKQKTLEWRRKQAELGNLSRADRETLEQIRSRVCSGKDAFPTEEAAMAFRTFRIKETKGMKELWPYKCTFCPDWHLGHPKKED